MNDLPFDVQMYIYKLYFSHHVLTNLLTTRKYYDKLHFFKTDNYAIDIFFTRMKEVELNKLSVKAFIYNERGAIQPGYQDKHSVVSVKNFFYHYDTEDNLVLSLTKAIFNDWWYNVGLTKYNSNGTLINPYKTVG